ncbi:hypothetical protein PAGL106935_12475 [Paenibacillus glucanolyticus]
MSICKLRRRYDGKLRKKTSTEAVCVVSAAISCDAGFLQQIRSLKFYGTVHTIFDRTVNLKCPNGELYTIATDSVDNAPNTLITDIDSFSKKGLAIGDQVYAEGERLYVGKNAAVMLQQVHVWRSKLPSYSEEEEILRNHVAAAQL